MKVLREDYDDQVKNETPESVMINMNNRKNKSKTPRQRGEVQR